MTLTRSLLLSLALGAFAAPAWAGGDPAEGKAKSAPCAACHGADGNSQIAANPKLAGQHASYIVRALKDYKSGARKNPIMAGFAAALSEQDMEDLAAYFSAQQGLYTPSLD